MEIEFFLPHLRRGRYDIYHKNYRNLYTRILSHKEQDTECFSLQWEVEDSRTLHQWHTAQGMKLNAEMLKVFKEKVIAFTTLMEVIE